MTVPGYITPECRILGIDTGLATMGWALLGAGDDDDLGAWTSTSQADRRGTTRARDLARRGLALVEHVSRLIGEHRPDIVAIEELSIPRHAGTATALGVAWGALTLQLEHEGALVISLPPQRVRSYLGITGSKASVVAVADPTGLWRERAEALPKGHRPHALDAVTVATAAVRTEAYASVMVGRGIARAEALAAARFQGVA